MRPVIVGFCVASLLSLNACNKDSSSGNNEAEVKTSEKYTAKVPPAPTAVAESVAQELKRCSPPADAKDMAARDKCSEALRNSAVFKACTGETILWGGRANDAKTYNPESHNLTELSTYIFNAMYLSLFTFPGEHTITENEGFVVLHAACDFRGEMETGAYPYPFWHKPAKWTDYNVCKNIDFVFEHGKLIAAYRSVEKKGDPKDIKMASHDFDGKWTWTTPDGKPMPAVSLYDYVLSAKNPHRDDLDKAYRELALESRKHRCMECHAPDNPTKMSKLTLLNYPNQALGARHDLFSEVDNNSMPPKTSDHAAGIANADDRKKLLDLAKRFAEVGDKALEFEDKNAKAR
jgi:hypothetical protein